MTLTLNLCKWRKYCQRNNGSRLLNQKWFQEQIKGKKINSKQPESQYESGFIRDPTVFLWSLVAKSFPAIIAPQMDWTESLVPLVMFYNVFFCFASDPTVLLKKPLCCYFRPADGLNCLRIEIAPPIDLVLPKLPITCIDLDPGSTCLRYKIPPLPPARPARPSGEEDIEKGGAGNCIGFKMEIFEIWEEGKLLSLYHCQLGEFFTWRDKHNKWNCHASKDAIVRYYY